MTLLITNQLWQESNTNINPKKLGDGAGVFVQNLDMRHADFRGLKAADAVHTLVGYEDGDPLGESVLLLLHFDGTAGAASFIDDSTYNRTMQVQNDAVHSASNALYGNSGDFPDQFTSSCVYTTDVTDLSLAKGDLTLEFTTYMEVLPDFPELFTLTDGSFVQFGCVFTDTAPARLEVYFNNYDLADTYATGNIVELDVLQRWAFERWRDGPTGDYHFSIYLNGTRVAHTTQGDAFSIDAITHCKFGKRLLSDINGYQGWADEIRLTGAARFEAATSYTLATEPFPNP